jgi:hypothetical protein
VTRWTHGGSGVRSTGFSVALAGALDAGSASGARGLAVATGEVTASHLQLQARVLVTRWPHGAEATRGAGDLLAILPSHHRADREALAQGDALLAFGATRGLTGGQARGPIQPLAAEEAPGTTRGLLHLAGTAAPALVAAKPRGTGVLQWLSGQHTGLALLPRARVDARTHQRPIIQGRQGLTGSPLRALQIRPAPTVAADSLALEGGQTQASQWTLTILASPAALPIGLELPRLFQSERRDRLHLPRAFIGPEIPVRRARQKHEWHGQQEPKDDGEEGALGHLHVTLQGRVLQSQYATLSAGQTFPSRP